MASVATITVNFYWDRDEPDGSLCICCGDQCFLHMWRLIFSAPKLCRQQTENTLCDSCHQCLMEG